ncbi:hypothetical protein acsn021_17150 [Anaerocolumna cellulosilytica]|uniref:Uncharacterized protein n=1 Tax=Anaerocolumna cellulosilytica TaxID=433286 RepID=A0A6S6QWP4_9FIRM|nr:BtrH N-terminal domain-containing protein [Anaerocolumna cellulosilytica]MBB5194891.1 hypothetical protein [Anaerocolumna cellulosilytica]BCJ94146.1 hypothetical protein acsn021_17150 [Anaerocolumna cellulosilytica]
MKRCELKNLTKTMEQMQPFNDFFYRDCFYNSLFSIINYGKGDTSNILANEIQLYDYVPANILEVGIVTISVEPMNKILENMNIFYDWSEQKADPYEIYDALDHDMPVIIMVDCFEESIREEYYHKEHLDHNLLIYGYDLEQKIFYIIEHSKKNRLDYKKKTIPIDVVLKASNAYIYHYQNEKQDAAIFYKFYQKQSKDGIKKNASTMFCENYLKYEVIIRMQFIKLDNIKDTLCKFIYNRKKLSECIDTITDEITNIINAKKIEQRKYKLFLNHTGVNQLIESILNGWIAIRLYLMSYQYGGTEIDRKLDEAAKRINEIVLEEKRLIRLVFFLLYK